MFASIVVAALGALPLFTQGVAAAPGDCVRDYIIKPGDTCNSIGAAEGASTYQIMAINSQIDYNCYNLQPDEKICLGTEGADCTSTYVVKSGDTCKKIEDAYGVNSTQFFTNNPNVDLNCSNIYSGEVVCVATSKLVPDAPTGFFQNQTLSTNQDPQPDTPYTPYVDTTQWEIVNPSDVQDGEVLPYCDEVGVRA
jgi:LysM repeat protein